MFHTIVLCTPVHTYVTLCLYSPGPCPTTLSMRKRCAPCRRCSMPTNFRRHFVILLFSKGIEVSSAGFRIPPGTQSICSSVIFLSLMKPLLQPERGRKKIRSRTRGERGAGSRIGTASSFFLSRSFFAVQTPHRWVPVQNVWCTPNTRTRLILHEET